MRYTLEMDTITMDTGWESNSPEDLVLAITRVVVVEVAVAIVVLRLGELTTELLLLVWAQMKVFYSSPIQFQLRLSVRDERETCRDQFTMEHVHRIYLGKRMSPTFPLHQ